MRLTEFSDGRVKLSSLVPGFRPGVSDVGHSATNFCAIGLIWPEGIRLNGTGVVVPGKRTCCAALAQVPEALNPAVHNADRSPARKAAFGTVTPVTGALPSSRIA